MWFLGSNNDFILKTRLDLKTDTFLLMVQERSEVLIQTIKIDNTASDEGVNFGPPMVSPNGQYIGFFFTNMDNETPPSFEVVVYKIEYDMKELPSRLGSGKIINLREHQKFTISGMFAHSEDGTDYYDTF
jgi:Neuraminidase (sialidase)